MADKFYQCCYTNLVTEDSSISNAGWQMVAYSPDLPSPVKKTCAPIHGAYSAIAKEVMTTYGKLNVWHFSSDSNFMYVTLFHFGGSLDIRGRANMFAHTFCVPCSDKGVAEDPNIFLGISLDNFKDNVTDAQIIPDELIYDERLSISSAMQKASLSIDAYRTLIHCIFAQMSDNKITEPLYVGYSGDISEMKAILYCIYIAVPYYIRKKLVCEIETVEKSKNGNLIFSTDASSHQRFVLPTTGENNVINKRIANTIIKNRFVDYVLTEKRIVNESKIKLYFEYLNKLAMEYGDVTASDGRVLKIAHLTLIQNENAIEKADDDEIQQRLSDALFVEKNITNEKLDSYVISLLNEVINRKIILSDGLEETLSSVISKNNNEEMADIYERYNIYRFSILDVEVACEKLKLIPENSFDRFIQQLAQYDDGIKIINFYYSNLYSNTTVSWKELQGIYNKIRYIKGTEEVQKSIKSLAWEKYCLELNNDPVSAYHFYIDFIEKSVIVSNNQLKTYKDGAMNAYWKNVKLEDFSFDRKQEYTVFSSSTSDKCKFITNLIRIVINGNSQQEVLFLKSLNELFDANQDLVKNATEPLIKQITVCASNSEILESEEIQKKWIEIAIKSSQSLFRKIVRVRSSIENADFINFQASMTEIHNELKKSDNVDCLKKLLYDVIIDLFFEIEDGGEIVPFDAWLLIGQFIYSNPNSIFDNIDYALIFDEDPEDVVMSSKLLKTEKGCKALGDYVNCKGKNFRIAKKWLSVIGKREKKSEKSEKSVFSRFIDNFSKNAEPKDKKKKDD